MPLDLSHEFPHPPALRYLNHAAVAPWPRRAAEAVQCFAQENLQWGASHYLDWLPVERELRQRLARLLNAPSTADIALVKNTSEALSFVAFGLDWRPGDQIIISDEEFPSNRIVWEALQPQGVEVIPVSLKGADPEADLLAACGPRTRLLAISAVQYGSGLRLDMERLGHGCQQRGVLLCIDAIQQLGAQPFDVQASGCAFAMADGHKWLLGPEGLGVFYCRQDLRQRLTLHEYGWHMVEHLGDYDRQDWQPASTARRFECGSPNMLATMALNASLSLLEEVGMSQIAQALEERIHWLHQALTKLQGIDLLSPACPERRAGILCFRLNGQNSASVFAQLTAAQVICAQRGGGIRLSPHFYTSTQVLEETLAIIATLR